MATETETETEAALRHAARHVVALALALRPFAELAAVRSLTDEAPDHVVWEARTGVGRARITRADIDRAQQVLAEVGALLPSLLEVAS